MSNPPGSNPYSDPTNPYSNDGGRIRPSLGEARIRSHSTPAHDPNQWESLGQGTDARRRGYEHPHGPLTTSYPPTYRAQSDVDGFGTRAKARQFSRGVKAGVNVTIAGLLVYLMGIFLPFATSDTLVVSDTGEDIRGSFATTNVLETNAPAWMTFALIMLALAIITYTASYRKRDDRSGRAVLVGTALSAGALLSIFTLSIALDGPLRAFYAAGGELGAGQVVMFVGSGMALVGALLTTAAVARS